MYRSRVGASLDERFTASNDASGVRLTVSAARTGDTNVYTLQVSILPWVLKVKIKRHLLKLVIPLYP